MRQCPWRHRFSSVGGVLSCWCILGRVFCSFCTEQSVHRRFTRLSATRRLTGTVLRDVHRPLSSIGSDFAACPDLPCRRFCKRSRVEIAVACRLASCWKRAIFFLFCDLQRWNTTATRYGCPGWRYSFCYQYVFVFQLNTEQYCTI